MSTIVKWLYGQMYCSFCDLSLIYCTCPATTLEQLHRGRLAVLEHLRAGAWRETCRRCGRLLAECNRDPNGCGSARAGGHGD